jgi:hypothetical protein
VVQVPWVIGGGPPPNVPGSIRVSGLFDWWSLGAAGAVAPGGAASVSGWPSITEWGIDARVRHTGTITASLPQDAEVRAAVRLPSSSGVTTTPQMLDSYMLGVAQDLTLAATGPITGVTLNTVVKAPGQPVFTFANELLLGP